MIEESVALEGVTAAVKVVLLLHATVAEEGLTETPVTKTGLTVIVHVPRLIPVPDTLAEIIAVPTFLPVTTHFEL